MAVDIRQVLKDPDYLGLPFEEKRKVLNAVDPDFVGLPAQEQRRVMNALNLGQPLADGSADKELKQLAAEFYRPALEMGGAVGGGLLGIGATSFTVGGVPLGAAAGGALGFAGGKAAADAIDRAIGLQAPIQNVPDALKQTGKDIRYGAVNEATGAAIRPAAQALAPVGKLIGNQAARVGQAVSGIEARKFKALANDPAAILPEIAGGSMSTKKAGEKLGKVLDKENLGLESNPFFEANKAAKTAWVKTKKALLGKGEPLTPQEMYEAKRAVDEVLEKTPWTQRKGRLWRDRTLFKNYLREEIGKFSGEYAGASKDYARAALGRDFLSPMSVNQGGTPSIMRSGIAAALGTTLGLNPLVGAVLTSPLSLGLGVAGSSAVAKGVNAALRNDVSRRAAGAGLGLGLRKEDRR